MALTNDELTAVAMNRFGKHPRVIYAVTDMTASWVDAIEPVLRAKIATEIRGATTTDTEELAKLIEATP